MLTKAARDFILHITDYFHGHWEDPDWGKTPVNQLLVGLVIRELSNGLQDGEIRGQLQALTDKVISRNAQGVAKGQNQ